MEPRNRFRRAGNRFPGLLSTFINPGSGILRNTPQKNPSLVVGKCSITPTWLIFLAIAFSTTTEDLFLQFYQLRPLRDSNYDQIQNLLQVINYLQHCTYILSHFLWSLLRATVKKYSSSNKQSGCHNQGDRSRTQHDFSLVWLEGW